MKQKTIWSHRGKRYAVVIQVDIDHIAKCGPVRRAVVRAIEGTKKATACNKAVEVLEVHEVTDADA